MTAQEETTLLIEAQAGDLAAFEQFVRLFERRVRGLLSRLLSDQRGRAPSASSGDPSWRAGRGDRARLIGRPRRPSVSIALRSFWLIARTSAGLVAGS
jgi:hypothetical protein